MQQCSTLQCTVRQTIFSQNENRGKLMSELEESTCAMFTGTIKISTLGSFGEYYVSMEGLISSRAMIKFRLTEWGGGCRRSHD